VAVVVNHSASGDDDDDCSLPPVLCTTCLAYMNLYCDTRQCGKIWICPFCQCENAMPTEEEEEDGTSSSPSTLLRDTVLVSPTLEFRQSLHSSTGSGEKDAWTIVLVIDTNLPALEAHSIGTMLKNLLKDEDELATRPIQLGLVLFGKNVSVYQLGVASGMASADTVRSHEGFLTSSSTMDKEYLTDSSNVDALLNCIAAEFGVRDNDPAESSTLASSSSNGAASSSTTAPPKKSRMQILKERKEARLRAQNDASSSNTANNNQQHNGNGHLPKSRWTAARAQAAAQRPPYRCTGEALQCAIDLVLSSSNGGTTAPSRTARILLFTDGCPNIGDGSVVATTGLLDDDQGAARQPVVKKAAASLYNTVDTVKLARSSEYFELVAKTAVEGGVGIDVLCTGSSELGLPAYQSLVEPSSGYVISHDSFATPHLQRNVGFLLKRTYLSLAQYAPPVVAEEEDQENSNPAVASSSPSKQQEEWIDGCTVDIRMSRYVKMPRCLL